MIELLWKNGNHCCFVCFCAEPHSDMNKINQFKWQGKKETPGHMVAMGTSDRRREHASYEEEQCPTSPL